MINQIRDPRKFRRLNGWLVIFWTAMFPIALLAGWMNLVTFVALLSLYANWATHLGVWAASRAEVEAADVHLEDEREERSIAREDIREERVRDELKRQIRLSRRRRKQR